MIENLLVCIGAQKAGTSWLDSVLRKDVRLNFCPFIKEIHYFDYIYNNSPHLNNWRANRFIKLVSKEGMELHRPLSEALSHEDRLYALPSRKTEKYSRLLTDIQLLSGPINDLWYTRLLTGHSQTSWSVDITPDYAVIGTNGFAHLKRIAKNLKIIFILRDPVERSWSGLLQGQKHKPGGLEEFFKTELKNIDRLLKICTVGEDVGKRSDYATTIYHLKEADLFHQCSIQYYDDLAARPGQFLKNLYDFIGLDFPNANEDLKQAIRARVHQTNGAILIPKPLESGLIDYYQEKLRGLASLVPVPRAWLSRRIHNAPI